MKEVDCIVIGAGPCGLSAAIQLEKKNISTIVIEKGNIVQAIYNYPTHQTFFSTSDKLEIGDVAFITSKPKPTRLDALTYYREVVKRKQLTIHNFEKALSVEKENDHFLIHTKTKQNNKKTYRAKFVVIATGYYDTPNDLKVPGSQLPHVKYYFKEGHPYFNQDVVVIGGRNSAIDASLELYRAGANVTVLYRGQNYSKSIKPWILPEFSSLVEKGKISMEFNAEIKEITQNRVIYKKNHMEKFVEANFVFAMIGYQPNIKFLQKAGVFVNTKTGIAQFDKNSYETNVEGLYLAGVVTTGFNNNAIFIENGRFHGEKIANHIKGKIK